ncbi:hypothetical protein EYR41_004019 [Orbilia oligospora]|uniref:Uncharacterized protein n=1 Tax=Orbilia oligospora TaxID=2813651 RepID=A0A7C8P6D0_ORBOL|nr:hypothetical protein TWF751_010003 [Orbilia oligospora]TGJ72106.1 hypothetical protein EYR41_004019 [Orbilia oligospora]
MNRNNNNTVLPSTMAQSNQHKQAYNFHTPYPAVVQTVPAAGSVGFPSHTRSHPQFHPSSFTSHPHHPQYDNINFSHMPFLPSSSHLYNNNPLPLPMVPPVFPLHPVPSQEGPYYHPQPFPPLPPSAFMSFHPIPRGFTSFVKPPQPPYNQLPSPIPSTGTSIFSTVFSNLNGPSSPTTTVASTITKKMTRKSPVIASTPRAPPDEDEEMDPMSPISMDFSDDGSPTNVYIKGLPESTTDKQLLEMVSPFGEVISSKAIIDRPSGSCKGYGFAKFTSVESAKACIEDLKSRSYEATVAKDSFYSRLKGLADLQSTNLYVSNLPINWNENKIISLFPGYKISKCRLLVSQKAQSRGVAFVTFEDRDVCDEVIEKFSGIQLHEKNHHLPLQVRYADTIAQKQLKKEQQAVGQFPKKSVLMNHKQTLEKGMRINSSKMHSGAPIPMHLRNWRASGAPPVNAPPTPPRSVISAEEDSLKDD